MASDEQNISRKKGLLIFFVFSVLILVGGHFYFFHEKESLKEDKAEALSAVAKLKSGQISSWYLDEIHDARIIANNNLLVEQIEGYLSERTQEELTQLRKILLNTSREHNYKYVLFLDTSWNLVTSEEIHYPELDSILHNAVKRSLNLKTVVSTGLYLCSLHKTIHIDFISSVTGDDGKILGALIMQVDPFEQFYPLIQTWPTPSKSSETMLVIKEGDSIRYMNELRHIKNTALKKTLPLSDANYTAVKAVTGSSGIVEGLDYRGIKVLSYVDYIPGTPWYMVAETDRSEVFKGLRIKGLWVVIFVLLIILMAGFGVGYVFAARQRNLYKILFHTREEFRATLYSIGDAVITTNTDGIIMYMNPVAEKLTGWKESEAKSKSLELVFRIINEYSREKAGNPVLKILNEGKIIGLANHALLITKDNREIPISDSGAPIFNERGETVGVVLVFRDQSEERIAVRALLESELRYRLLFENHIAVKLLIDANTGDIVKANHAASKFYGWDDKVLCTMNIRQISTLPEKEVIKTLQDVRKRNKVFFEFKHRCADNSLKDVEIYSSLVQTKEGELVHSIIHDVTNRKEAEKQLRLLSKSVEQSPVSIIITDANGQIEYVNSGFSKTTGYTKEEAIGKNPRFMSSGLQDADFYRNLWKVITSGKDWQGEFINTRKSGENYWESTIITPVMDDTGEITHFIGIKEDVTSLKKMLEELVKAKEKAEESERLKSSFLANMSHEIRTPLNGILGFTNLLTSSEKLPAAKKKQYGEIINKSAEGLLHIINDVLDISRLESGQMEIENKNFDLNQMLIHLYNIFLIEMGNLNKDGVDLKVHIPDSKIILKSDEKRLFQVLTNLLNNAIKFTNKGIIEFGVSSFKSEDIELFVKDTGIGISPEKHDIIFERFRQADDTIAISYGGSGLGLSIVKQLVDLMGGKINLESKPESGTIFRILLPYNYK